MVLVATIMVLAAVALAYWGAISVWRKPGPALAAIASAVILAGGAWGILHAIGYQGF